MDELDAAAREAGIRSLRFFVEEMWPVVEPGIPFVPGRHVDAICAHLEAVSAGDIRKLLINIPPGCMKSLLVNVFWHAWEWIHRPTTRYISVSFDANLTLRDSRKVIQILRSEEFRHLWGDLVSLPADVAASDFSNMQGGWKFATSIQGKLVGRHADIITIDDPVKPLEINGAALETCKQWWHETLPTRFRDPKTGRRVLVMQRLHEDDLSGIALKEEGWERLILPMRYEKNRHCYDTCIGGEDWRKDEGELLWPERFGEEEVKRIEKDLLARGAAAQLQQSPTPAGGLVFKASWFKKYGVAPAKMDQIIQSWDAAFKGTSDSDYVCGQVWGKAGGEYYLLDQVHGHWDFPETCAQIKALSKRWPKATAKLVEDKANGPAIIDTLKKEISGLIAVTPEGGKEARANAVAPLYEAGNVYHPEETWVDGLEAEMTGFPFARNDDRVDAMTQALLWMHQKTSSYRAAMKNWEGMMT